MTNTKSGAFHYQKRNDNHDRLLAAVNEAALSVRNGWIFFVGMMAFFFIAVAGVTHQDLLLNSPVELPLVKIDIELTRFFQFAPLAVVLFHFGILLQYTLLAGKTLALHDILSAEETEAGENGKHPLRMELSSYFFVQAMAGPARSPILSIFLKAMTLLTLGLFPLILLIYFQTTYLAFHDPVVTWAHRLYVLADLLVLIIIGVFTQFPNQELKDAFSSHIRQHSIGVYLIVSLSGLALFYSFCVATIPDSWLDKTMTALGKPVYLSASLPYGGGNSKGREAFLPTAWLFEGRIDETRGKAASWFSRNLTVIDVDLVPYVNADREKANEVSLHLRGRDLRYADFSQSDMHRADFKEADLTLATLSQANLNYARFRGARLGGSNMRGAKLEHADLRWAKMKNTDLRETLLNNANLSPANLQDANMSGAELQHAKLEWANLLGVNLDQANLREANLSHVNLQGANLNGVELQGADLFKANLHGANLRNAQMQRVILLWANLKAADLRGAKIQGGDLRSSEMQFTDLRGAMMQGVNLKGTRLTFADLRGVKIWQTNPPIENSFKQVVGKNISLKSPSLKEDEQESYNYFHKKTPQKKRREANEKRLALLKNKKTQRAWKNTSEHKVWQDLKTNKEALDEGAYSIGLSEALAKLACHDNSPKAWVANAIIKRATDVYKRQKHTDSTNYFPPFNGNITALYKRLSAESCKMKHKFSKQWLEKLKILAR